MMMKAELRMRMRIGIFWMVSRKGKGFETRVLFQCAGMFIG